MNEPIDAIKNGHGGYTVIFQSGDKIEHIIAFSPKHAFEMVKCRPEYYRISKINTICHNIKGEKSDG